MSIQERQRHRLGRTVFTLPGDTLTARVQDRKKKEEIEFIETIGRVIEIDTVVTFDCSNLLGVAGFGAAMGKSI